MSNTAAFSPLTAQEKSANVNGKKPGNDEGIAIAPVPDDVALEIPQHNLGKPATIWDYRDAKRGLLQHVCRFILPDGEKEDRPLTYREYKDGSRRWAYKGLAVPRPLYGLDRLAARPDAPVIVCEGEKATDVATNLFSDFVCVTSPNGAGSPHCADWMPLQGRRVIIWPDHDDDGRKYAAGVAQLVIKVNKGSKS
jgi:hypothetical protein